MCDPKEYLDNLPCLVCEGANEKGEGTICDPCWSLASVDPEGKIPYVEPKTYKEEFHKLTDKGYVDLGWSNGGEGQHSPQAEGIEFVHVFSTRSGTSCLYANHSAKLMYSVDMGD